MAQESLSRRMMLGSAVLGAMFGASTVWADPAAKKTSKKEASYQDQPKGEEAKCSNCKFFMPPAGCQVVEGTISPAGWCQLFSKKAS